MMGEMPKNDTKQKEDRYELASIVVSQVSIEAVLLAESRTKRTHDFASRHETLEFGSIIREVGFGIEREQKKIFIVPSFSIRCQIEGEDDPDDSLVIDATFVLIYSIESAEGIENQHIEAFGSTSGIYNAWPYWREFVQNSSVRMGLRPVVVPPYRF